MTHPARPVRLEIDGSVGILRLDRPPVNAINRAMHDGLRAVAAEIEASPQVRAVVLWGGERAFAAGGDIKEMAALRPDQVGPFTESITSAVDAVARLPIPVLAAVTGYALGGGLELALAADLRIVAEDASLGLPEITLGVMPGAGGTQRLARLVGPARTKKMIFFGEPVNGTQAAACGLADGAVPAAEVMPVAMAMAGRLAAGPTAALIASKRAIDGGLDTELPAGLRLETELFADLFGTADQVTGMRSFLSDGPGRARFTGR